MAAPSGAIRAGRAFVEMFADPSALIRTMEAAKKRVEAFGKHMGKIGLTAAAAGGAVFAPLAKLFSRAVEEGADVAGLARRYQMPVAALSELKNAFAEAGVEGQEFGSTLDNLASQIAAAADANGELIPGLQGLRGNMLIGMDPARQLEAVFDAFERIQSVSDQINVAKQLGMEKLLPWLKKGKAGLEELRAQGAKNNEGWGAQDAADAEQVFKEYQQTLRSVKATILEVGKALLPTGQDFASVGADIRRNLEAAREWIRDNRQIIVIVTAVAGAVLAGGLAIAGFGGAVAVVAPIIGGLIIAVKATVAVVGALVGPLGLVVAAVAAAGVGLYLLATRTEAGRAALADLKGAMADAAEFIKGSWNGITDAISAGDFKLAFEIGLKSAEVAWKTFIVKLTTTWVGFKSVFVDTWEDATGWIAKAMVHLGASIEKNLLGVIRKIVDGFNSVAGAIDDSLTIKIPALRSDAEIERERDNLKEGIDQLTKAEKRRRNEFRKGQVDEAQSALDIAKEQLEILKRQAEEASKKAEWDRIPWIEYEDETEETRKPPSFSALSEMAKGTFGGASIQQALGYGDNVGQRQLDAQLGIQSNTAKTAAAVEKLLDKPGATFTA